MIQGPRQANEKVCEKPDLLAVSQKIKAAGRTLVGIGCEGDDFKACYNQELLHQAIEMKYPAELYRPSMRSYRGMSELDYPFHDHTVTVTHRGRTCLGKRKTDLSQAFAGQEVGTKEVSDRIQVVTFMHHDLGFFDHETCRFEPVNNPFEPKASTMPPV